LGILEGIMGVIVAVFQLLGLVLFKFYGWVIVVAVLGYLIMQNRRREQWVNDVDTTLLLIEMPRDNEKKELSAEQMFASLHGILRPKAELIKEGTLQEHVSFEIIARENTIQFYVWTPTHLKDFVESQIYAQYPSVQIKEGVDDYAKTEPGNRAIYGTELTLTRDDVLPIKTFASFEVDPLAGITAVLAKLEQQGEEVWIQILARPVDDSWQDKGKKYVDAVKAGKSGGDLWARLTTEFLGLSAHILATFFHALTAPPTPAKDTKAAEKKVELSTSQQTAIKAVEEKITKLGYEVHVRIAHLGPDETLGRQRIQAIVGGFKQFNTTNLNGFTPGKMFNSVEFLEDYQARLFLGAGSILNIEELASLYHLPHSSVETPNMAWTTSKTSEPPSSLPIEGATEADEVSLFGLTNFRGKHLKFGLKRRDRGRHAYIIGQTGAGKSMLLQLLTLSDVYHNVGFAIVDPHGDYATDIMKYIPEHRLKDVVYFDATDRDNPMAFNPMEVEDGNPKNHISSELVGVLKRMFENSWGPRLEYILRYAILALLDYPGATMLDITRMLTEKDFRKKVIKEINDPVVRTFWVTEFASWNEKFASEAVAPILNKVGAFVADPLVRNIVGQQKSAFNIRRIMDEGKILIINLSRGQVGEDNAAILGSLMVTKIQLAAMSRADTALEDRRPFYLYVDEFQNFATDSFAVIMSEARKYGLNLTVANQYIAQMPETVRDAVFGNVGTMVSFRIGPGDSTIMAEYFQPVFEAADIRVLNNQNIFISMIINGEKAAPFSARTLRMPDPENDMSEEIVRLSRQQYASRRADVEEDIRRRQEGEDLAGPAVDQGARAVGVLADGRPAPAGGVLLGGQNPNKPKSEFLNALQNPTTTAPAQKPMFASRAGENRGRDDRSGSSNRDRDNRGSDRRPDRGGRDGGRDGARDNRGGGSDRRGSGSGSGQPGNWRDAARANDERNEAVRKAIETTRANIQQQQTQQVAPTPSTPAHVAPQQPAEAGEQQHQPAQHHAPSHQPAPQPLQQPVAPTVPSAAVQSGSHDVQPGQNISFR
jgi:hypothetical protein